MIHRTDWSLSCLEHGYSFMISVSGLYLYNTRFEEVHVFLYRGVCRCLVEEDGPFLGSAGQPDTRGVSGAIPAGAQQVCDGTLDTGLEGGQTAGGKEVS